MSQISNSRPRKKAEVHSKNGRKAKMVEAGRIGCGTGHSLECI